MSCTAKGYDDKDRELIAEGHTVAPWHCTQPEGHAGDHSVDGGTRVHGPIVWTPATSTDDDPRVDVLAQEMCTAPTLPNHTYCRGKARALLARLDAAAPSPDRADRDEDGAMTPSERVAALGALDSRADRDGDTGGDDEASQISDVTPERVAKLRASLQMVNETVRRRTEALRDALGASTDATHLHLVERARTLAGAARHEASTAHTLLEVHEALVAAGEDGTGDIVVRLRRALASRTSPVTEPGREALVQAFMAAEVQYVEDGGQPTWWPPDHPEEAERMADVALSVFRASSGTEPGREALTKWLDERIVDVEKRKDDAATMEWHNAAGRLHERASALREVRARLGASSGTATTGSGHTR